MNQADRDDFEGKEWANSLGIPEHFAAPAALNGAGTLFQARCRCSFLGPVRATRRREGDLAARQRAAKFDAQLDADEHNAKYAGPADRAE